jgi:hypothetical protein
MLHRTVSPGDVIKVSGPCEIRVRRSRGRMNFYFDAPKSTKILQVTKKSRLDKSREKGQN